jgi:MFS family permease
MYTIYYAIHAVSMAGINSAATNLVYDYVPRARRTGSLAVKNTFAGFAGFFTTLAVSPLVDHIQNAGNKFLGIGVYAQQVLSLIGLIITVLCILYLNLVVKRLHKPSSLVFNDGTTE